MDDRNNISRNKAFDRLPVHRPDEDLWNHIQSVLNAGEADGYREAVSKLPVHKAPAALWNSIERQLGRRRNRLTLIWFGIATAASLVIFGILNLPKNDLTRPEINAPSVAKQKTDIFQGNNSNKESTLTTSKSKHVNTSEPIHDKANEASYPIPVLKQAFDKTALLNPVLRTSLSSFKTSPAIFISYRPEIIEITYRRMTPESISRESGQQPVIVINNAQNPVPVAPAIPRKLALALGYLPESLSNGYNSTLFHNVDLTASLDLKKYRFSSRLGMGYNAEHLDYTVKSTPNFDGMGNSADSTAGMMESVSQFEGTEKHGFISWDIGAGRKLLTTRKLTTWVNAGAGMAVRVNNASLRDVTVETLKSSYNATVNSIDIESPDYNRVNMSLITGIEFDYRLLKRLSLTLQPQARYYFLPIFTNAENSPDSFSLGFRTGMKFDL
jgi:hypothetical protein